MRTRIAIATLLFMLTQGVLFGIGIVSILATPLSTHAMTLIPWMIASTFVLAAPFAWWMAPRMRARYWRHKNWQNSASDRALAALS